MSEKPDDLLDVVQVLQKENPKLSPAWRPPGPGFWMSLVWFLLLMGIQIAVAFGLIIGIIFWRPFIPIPIPEETTKLVYLAGATAANLVTALVVVLLLFGRQAPNILALRGFTALHLVLVVLLGLAALVAVSALTDLAGIIVPHWHLQDRTVHALSKAPVPVMLLLGALLPGLGEEIYFRAFLGRGLMARYGLVLGICLMAIFFGLMHIDPLLACGAAVMGVILQIIFVCCKSLWLPVLLHGLNNALSVSFPVLDHPGWQLGMGAWGVVLFLLMLLYQTRVHWILPNGNTWSPGYVTAEMPPARLNAVTKTERPRWWTAILALQVYGLFVAILLQKLHVI